LHLARLTDPPKSGRDKENLTIKRLPQLISDPKKAQEVSGLIEIAYRSTAFARDWRNRRIAHRDLRLAMEKGSTPLEPASRQKVKEALNCIAEVLNAVEMHYAKSTTYYDLTISAPGGVGSLLHILHDGVRTNAERRKRIERGEFRDDDFEPRDL